MNPQIYYRLLYTNEHCENWNLNHFNSYHLTICGAWIMAYNEGKRNLSDYVLKQPEGTYTQKAAENYLKLQPKYASGELWNTQDLLLCSELDGVCAFEDLESAIRYVEGSESDNTPIAIFEGIEISKIPESGAGYSGVLVRPTRKIGIRKMNKSMDKGTL